MTDATRPGAPEPGAPPEARPDLQPEASVRAPLRRPSVGLMVEFAAFYLAVPFALAFLLPSAWMWPMLGFATVAGIALMFLTPGFEPRELLRLPTRRDWLIFAVFAILLPIGAAALCWVLRPGMLFWLPRQRPDLLLMILLLYPLVSALPQELFFRALFHVRYGALFPDRRTEMLANAAVFSLAHMFFWNWVAPALTFAGALIFHWAFVERRSFVLALAMHAVAGNAIFLVGLGIYFYHGVLPR
jgi:uncharacterized protein